MNPVSSAPAYLALLGLSTLGILAWSPETTVGDPVEKSTAGPPHEIGTMSLRQDEGIPVTNAEVVDNCGMCHQVDERGMMGRISYLRKTPEGWQATIRRMGGLYGVALEPPEAREIARYLANQHGLAPEELRPGLFEAERRLIDYTYEANEGVQASCTRCHSLGRVITQRRTPEEWDLLMDTHIALYPLANNQGVGGDAREGNVAHLAEAFPLQTPEWAAWSSTVRPPRLEGTWTLTGREPGRGPIYGTVVIEAGASDDEFTTRATYEAPATETRTERQGSSIIYTGYQWRGRSLAGGNEEEALREVMFVERDWQTMSGRWFTGAYDELGPDVTLRRVGTAPMVTGVYPSAVQRGGSRTVQVFGANLPQVAPTDLDFGPGVRVSRVASATDQMLEIVLDVEVGAAEGARDLFLGGASLREAVVVYDDVDRIEVRPEWGMARIGGVNLPKAYQQFEAVGFSDGPDGEANTEDDLDLGIVDATWRLEEYTATFGDDDVRFVGAIAPDGLFTPAVDGPNPDRTGSRNNVGDVWAVASFTPPGVSTALQARAHLLVTVPLYLRWAPWGEVP